MAIGERIHFFRTMRGMTQKYLGMLLGFPEKSADVRLAQYETGARTPKADLTASLANALGVSPLALSVPDIDSYLGLMHTLFTLEDRYGLTIDELDGEVCLRVNVRHSKNAARLHEMLCSWRQAAAMLKAGEISQEDYDRWRYRYPEFSNTPGRVKPISQDLHGNQFCKTEQIAEGFSRQWNIICERGRLELETALNCLIKLKANFLSMFRFC